MENFIRSIYTLIHNYFVMPTIYVTDVVEVLILAFVIYEIILWVRRTRAWTLLKGMIILIVLMLVAYFLKLNTILWIANKTLNVGIIALMIMFQPELRKALEQLGRKRYFTGLFKVEEIEGFLENDVVEEIVKGTFEMAKTKTGALMVIERDISLEEYENTGIALDSKVSSQLIINIFEHNTPLHDGAVIIRDNRIVSATCYLPLSDSKEISKELGTRHRAGLGISEVTDSVTIIVSEETGRVTVAKDGELIPCKTGDSLRDELQPSFDEFREVKKFKLLKGRGRQNEKNSSDHKKSTN